MLVAVVALPATGQSRCPSCCYLTSISLSHHHNFTTC